jgi:hypothetical protein
MNVARFLDTTALLIVAIAAISVVRIAIDAYKMRVLKSKTASNSSAAASCEGCTSCSSRTLDTHAHRLTNVQPIRWTNPRQPVARRL